MIVSPLTSQAWHAFALRHAWRGVGELRRFRTATASMRRRTYAARLQERLREAASRDDALPEWREATRIADPEELLSHWHELPILTKQLLRERFPPDAFAERYRLRGRISASGGSTGEPTRFFHDERMLAASEAKAYYVRTRLGWSPGMATICIWGSDRDIGRRDPLVKQIVGALRRDIVISGYRVDASTLRRFVGAVTAHAPVAVYGFTSMLVHVARLALESGVSLAPGAIRVAWNGGEVLTSDQSALFARAFGVPIRNLYGGRELSTIACQFEAGGPLEVLAPFDYVEIVDEHGRPAPPGMTGRLVISSTVCRGTPFLRYEIGDMAVADTQHRDVGGIFALREIAGRVSGVIELADGKTLSNLYWNHLFKEYPEVQQFQVVVRNGGRVHLRLRGTGFGEQSEASLRHRLDALLAGMVVTYEWVSEIPLTRLGKLLQVIDERSAHPGPSA